MPTGRPRKEIDTEQFKKLCGLQCTEEEIAGFFDVSVDTIERYCKRTFNLTFAEAFKKHSAAGKISLRRMQFKLAEKSAAMGIWLGKQYLDQKDIPDLGDEESLKRAREILGGIESAID